MPLSRIVFAIVILLLKMNCFFDFKRSKAHPFRCGNKLIFHIIAPMDNTDNSRSVFLYWSIDAQ